MHRLTSLLLLGMTLGFAWSSGAGAQSVGRALARTGLVQDDIDIMVRSGASLYASGNAVAGADVLWSNPATGAYGMVELLQVGGGCVRIAYRFRTQRRPNTQTVTTRRCRDGERWLLSD